MKNFETIYNEINERFTKYTKKSITENSTMDFYSVAMADTLEKVYGDIEEMKNPHIYSKLREGNLDDLGFFMNMPREVGESDYQYLYRLMNWKYTAEASNLRAINNALLNTTYSSDAEYIPQLNGSGTGTVYIIPKTYEIEMIENAINEAMEIVKPVVSPGMYIEYIVPRPVPVILNVAISSSTGDMESIKREITKNVKEYVNNIPPNQYMQVGVINRIGINEELVDYFSVLQIFVDRAEQDEIDVYQSIAEKYLLDQIVWNEE